MNLEIEFIPADTPASQPPTQVSEEIPVEVEEGSWIWAVLLWILTPPLLLFRQTIKLGLWIDLRFIHDRKISNLAKCPGCGIREFHEFQFAEDYERVIHTCKRCKAEWAERPVVPYTRWKIGRTLEKQPEENLPGIL